MDITIDRAGKTILEFLVNVVMLYYVRLFPLYQFITKVNTQKV